MKPVPVPLAEEPRRLLRHTLATLAYRAGKVLRDVPEDFGGVHLSPTTRTPLETVAHMGDLMDWGERMARGVFHWEAAPAGAWPETVDRFFERLAAFDAALADGTQVPLQAEVMFQGPVADALTHVGQLALIRGTMASPVRPESYARAEIVVGRVGRDQAPARYEFSGDASKPRAD